MIRAGFSSLPCLCLWSLEPWGRKTPRLFPRGIPTTACWLPRIPGWTRRPTRRNLRKKLQWTPGVAAIDVYFRNDTDKLIRIDLDSIRLVYAPPDGDRQKPLPLAAQDAADLILHPGSSKNPSVPRTRLPLPGRGPKKSRGKDWDELTASLEAAALQTDVVGPHTTEHGLLYFDMQHQYDMLRYTKLYIPDLTFVEKNQPLV